MAPDLSPFQSAIKRFAAEASRKLGAIAVKGEPEDQIRGPLEVLFGDLVELAGIKREHVVLVGESSIADLKSRPDYAVQRRNELVGFIEVKAPGKGGDPRRFKIDHDKDQWKRLKALPNLIYTDGNEFSLWRDGELVGKVVSLDVDLGDSSSTATDAPGLAALVEDFLSWEPIPPKTPKQLAELTARVCRLMRDEVEEQLDADHPALTTLAAEWRVLLFPNADDATFADGYAQAVTFGLLVARARDIPVDNGVTAAANEIGVDSLIGAALLVLGLGTEKDAALTTSIGTLTRLLAVVDWPTISKGAADAWLYFYEDFLSVYDNKLRKKTGSYYTPPEVVTAMVGLVEGTLRTRFDMTAGLADPQVTLIDPAVGTGTFLLAALRAIARTVEDDEGSGAVAGRIEAAVSRLIGFELQIGPYAVAQLRLLAELVDLGAGTSANLSMYVTDTLANPYVEDEHLGAFYEPIARSRQEANRIKKDQPVLVVLGNPPYKEKAKGLGGWIESGHLEAAREAPLAAWQPPREWGVGTHAKHLRNLYVYFWRWATWKVFDHHPGEDKGIVCFITVAGFLNGPGFQMMRSYLRRTCDELWVIDCSPEGHQPAVSTRIFQGVQQPVCIVMASRSDSVGDEPATVRFRALPEGDRTAKFEALAAIDVDDDGWAICPDGWRAPFLPASIGAWSTYPALTDLFVYDGSGVMPGRTWVIAPDAGSLAERWDALLAAPSADQEELFHPHEGGDRTMAKVVRGGLGNVPENLLPVDAEHGPVVQPLRYGFRTLDRQWIIPDKRVLNRPNPSLWDAISPTQLHLTALHLNPPTSGPSATITGLIPDIHHYKGSFGGRVMPLWLDHAATVANLKPGILTHLQAVLEIDIAPADLFAYVVGLVSSPSFTHRFAEDLSTPGLRVPLTADPDLFQQAVQVGRRSVWLQTFGERMATGQPVGPPRLPESRAPKIPKDGAIPTSPGVMPDHIAYDPTKNRLLVGEGWVDGVTPEMWAYNVSGKDVLTQWFSYRGADRSRPLMGDRRPPSKLTTIQPDHWLAEYTTELINLLNVIGLLIDLEPVQADLLGLRISAGCDRGE